MLKRRLPDDDESSEPGREKHETVKRMAQNNSDVRPVDFVDQLRKLQWENKQLQSRVAAADAKAKQYAADAAKAAGLMKGLKTTVEKMNKDNSSLVEANKLVAKLTEKCGVLKYERDGLKSRLKKMEKIEGKEEKSHAQATTRLELEGKVDWYTKNFITEQKRVQEERDKCKAIEAELTSRISALETKLNQMDEENQSVVLSLKNADEECKKLTKSNNRLVGELNSSFDTRVKLNTNVDHLERSLKEMRGLYEGNISKLQSAQEYIASMEKMMEKSKSFPPSLPSPMYPSHGAFNHPNVSSSPFNHPTVSSSPFTHPTVSPSPFTNPTVSSPPSHIDLHAPPFQPPHNMNQRNPYGPDPQFYRNQK